MAEYIRAVVVFSEKHRPILFGRRVRPSFWLRFLKPGFTHCFVTILTDMGWVALDPLGRMTKVGWSGAEKDITGPGLCRIYTKDKGLTAAVYLILPAQRKMLLPLPATCVEIVRRALSLPCLSLTPWRLYRRLSQHPGTIFRIGPPI